MRLFSFARPIVYPEKHDKDKTIKNRLVLYGNFAGIPVIFYALNLMVIFFFTARVSLTLPRFFFFLTLSQRTTVNTSGWCPLNRKSGLLWWFQR